MNRNQQPAVTFFAIGLIGLGVLALIYRDFALVWQPVPAWVPGRIVLAYCAGLIMLLGGIGLLFEATAAWSVRVLLPYLTIWFLLKVPAIVVAPRVEAVWLGLGELAVLLSGGYVLFAKLSQVREGSPLARLTSSRSIRAAQKVFAISLIPIGLSHIVYVKEAAELVPPWLLFRPAWAYLTGVGQMACGLGVLFSVFPKLAATIEAGMIGIFTALVWAPAVAAAPRTRLPWTAFFISWVIGSAAWLVAQSIELKGQASLKSSGASESR